MKRLCALLIGVILLTSIRIPMKVYAEPGNNPLEITSTAAVLMEGSTGQVIYEKNKDEKLKPALLKL